MEIARSAHADRAIVLFPAASRVCGGSTGIRLHPVRTGHAAVIPRNNCLAGCTGNIWILRGASGSRAARRGVAGSHAAAGGARRRRRLRHRDAQWSDQQRGSEQKGARF